MNWLCRSIIVGVSFSPCICLAQNEGGSTAEAAAPDNSAAIGALVRLTRDQDAAVRMTAFSALSRIGEETPAVVDAVQAGLQDDEPGVRVEAFGTLIGAVRDDKVKVDALLMIVQDENEELAMRAAQQLGQLGRPAVPHLIAAMKNEKLRLLIVRTLGSLGSDAREAIPAITEMLKTDDAGLRAILANCLGEICGPQVRRPTSAFTTSGRSGRGGSAAPDSATVARFIEAVWPRLDSDADGKLSPDEQSKFRSLDAASADVDGDSAISREEFDTWYSGMIRNRGFNRGVPAGGGFGGPSPDGR